METVHSCPEWQEDDWNNDWTGQIEQLAQTILQALGCFEPPVSREFLHATLQPFQERKPVSHEKGPLKVQPKAVLETALRVMEKQGLSLPGKEPRVLAYLVDQVLSPSFWVRTLWRQKQSLPELVQAFPCLQGERFAKRMAQCLTNLPGTEIGWVQGGKLIWRQRAPSGRGSLELGPLEARCWRSCRDYSRFTVLAEGQSQVQCWPWHRIFPKGELLLSQTQEFGGETD